MNILDFLTENRDEKYKSFMASLIPNIDSDTIIGVRTPVLRTLSKKLKNSGERKGFLKSLPHSYYEENNLHGFFICQIGDFDECIKELELFLPHVDNWATCDSLRPKCFKNNREKLISEIKRWISSSHPYTVRFAIEMLMVHFLDVEFDSSYPQMVSMVHSDEYYVNMMIAWYFATALSKKWDDVFPYIKEKRLPLQIHNKTIRKAIESYRISDPQKMLLRKEQITEK